MEPAAQTVEALPAERPVSVRDWIAVCGMMLGAFMAILDIQITNASLKDIQGSLAATLDEGSWLTTSYLVAEIIVIPLTGWLAQVFGRKRYVLWNAGLFLVFSVACAWAWNLPSMILFRAMQGFTGGVLIPMAFSVMYDTLPPSRRPVGLALFAMTATFAPSIGPTVGGWLTENLGWPFCFYLNLLPGGALMAAVWYGLPSERPRLFLLRRGDWAGIGCMALGLGSLQVFLEEGNRKDWFGSDLIRISAAAAAVFLAAFVAVELRRREPFINLRLLVERNFGLAGVVNLGVGAVLYGSVYLLPVFMTTVKGFNALQIGEIMMWSGLPQLFVIPLIPLILRRFDARAVVMAGVLLIAASCAMNTVMTRDTGRDQLVASLVVRALGQPLVMTGLTQIAMSRIRSAETGSASGLFNMTRNLGGSIGIALLSTLLTRRTQFHGFMLGERIHALSESVQERVEQVALALQQRGLDLEQARLQSLEVLRLALRREAAVMAFNDSFLVLAGGFLLAGAAVLLTGKAPPGEAAAGH